MRQLGDLLATIPFPESKIGPSPESKTGPSKNSKSGASGSSSGSSSEASPPETASAAAPIDLVTKLAAGLPAGHVHLWGGPDGAGKTSFLLSLLSGAAQCKRRVVYATYDLSAATLAHRLLAMTAGVAPERVPDPAGTLDACDLKSDEWGRLRASRRYLRTLPFSILEARGFTTESLRDRLVRMPFRADVMAVDYLQAVVRDRDTKLRAAVTQLTELAHGLHVSVVCAVRPDEGARSREVASRGFATAKGVLPDRVGWIEPAGEWDRHAEIVVNRHGPQTSSVLRMHASGALERK